MQTAKFSYTQTQAKTNSNIVGGKATGTKKFVSGCYGLTDFPAEFQKAIDMTFSGLTNTRCFLDESLIASSGSKEDVIILVEKCLQQLDKENFVISLKNVQFHCRRK